MSDRKQRRNVKTTTFINQYSIILLMKDRLKCNYVDSPFYEQWSAFIPRCRIVCTNDWSD